MRILPFFLTVVASAVMISESCALDMNVRTDDNEKLAFVNLWGSVELGDDDRFRSLVTPYLKPGYLIIQVNIFSGGGSVTAAMGIGDQIRLLQTRTVAPTRFSDIVNGQQVQRSYPSCWFTENYGVPKPVEVYDWCTCTSACFLTYRLRSDGFSAAPPLPNSRRHSCIARPR